MAAAATVGAVLLNSDGAAFAQEEAAFQHIELLLGVELEALFILGCTLLLRQSRPWAWRHPWLAAALRLAVTALAAAWAPVQITAVWPLMFRAVNPLVSSEVSRWAIPCCFSLPAAGAIAQAGLMPAPRARAPSASLPAHCCCLCFLLVLVRPLKGVNSCELPKPASPLLSPRSHSCMQALFLLILALLLPLPLERLLLVQALSLRMALPRLQQLSVQHALLPGGATQCTSFVRYARLAMPIAVPGTPAELPLMPQPTQCCWMLHTWVAAMVGFVLPTVAQIGAWKYPRQLRQTPLLDDPRHEEPKRQPEAQQEHEEPSSSRRPVAANRRQRSQEGQAAAASPSAEGSRDSSGSSSQLSDPDGCRGAASRRHRRQVAAALLVGTLGQGLLLLGLTGALVWAALELIAP